ncbi:MAG TPA: DUF427 domain-containing protein [Solirubrobacteraceae bacterium]|nr:DUF427 domain-containing protein [Solirubrobacteraceae bacterium]
MTGTGPLGKKPAGTFNYEPPTPGSAMYMEPSPKWLRVVVGGETIADSRRTLLLSESGHQPVYYFPHEDLRADLLEPSQRHTRCPKKGEASYFTIRVGDTVVEAGAWYYPEPIKGAEPLKDLVAFYFDRMDHWYEEDEEVFVHPRDPYHRVDVIATSRHLRFSLDGELLAESERALALFESNLPIRWYLPAEDVSAEREPTDTVTRCPYKGTASYYAVRRENGELVKDLIWYYEDPLPAVASIAGRLCFFNERVDVEVDGELEGRPDTAWSRGVKSEAAAIGQSGS